MLGGPGMEEQAEQSDNESYSNTVVDDGADDGAVCNLKRKRVYAFARSGRARLRE